VYVQARLAYLRVNVCVEAFISVNVSLTWPKANFQPKRMPNLPKTERSEIREIAKYFMISMRQQAVPQSNSQAHRNPFVLFRKVVQQ